MRQGITVTGDELRQTMSDMYPRSGWKARNLQADSGRVYDFVDYRDKQAMVELDWQDWIVTAYWEGKAIFEGKIPGHDDTDQQRAFRAVEDAAAAYLTGRRAADPYYQER